MIDWEKRYRELEHQIEFMLRRVAVSMDEANEKSQWLAPAIRSVEKSAYINGEELVVLADGVNLEYALYLYFDGGRVEKRSYQRANVFHVMGPKPNRGRAFVRSGNFPEETVSHSVSF